ncbi:MAG: Minf_1886 family protein [Gemmatimonadota bacterium]
MTDVQFADEILHRLKERNPRFQGKAYLFVLSALHHVIHELDEPRHISGAELAYGVRSLALERFGPLARTVLEHWGIHTTEDMGEIVFALVEAGVLITQEQDRPEDFRGLFEFEEAFDRDYPWTAG